MLAAIDAAFAEIERIEPALSDWKDVSELNTLNKRAGTEPMPVSPELFELLTFSRRLSEASEGAFDITFASMRGLWSFKPGEERVPTAAELNERLPLIDYHRVVLDPVKRTAAITRAGSRIGLGSVSDGYSAHRASLILTQRGYPDHLVLSGGDGCASGARLDRPWRVGIRDPETGGIWGALALQDEAIATSGNYQKFFLKDGVRYHHILDARTGMPARGTSSVTVITKGALMADGWATTLFILGPKRGLEVARQEGLDALWFDEDFVVTGTPGMLARIQHE